MTEQLKPDWSTADVSDGKLTVELSAKPPKKWRDAFERATTLLNPGAWKVTLNSRKGSVQIAPVQPGDEERVRQFVEGGVLQANATLVSEEELFGTGPADDEEQEEEAEDSDASEPSPDEELTGRFRAFAEQHDDEDDDDGEESRG
jgi:hypothetical protein